MIRAAAEAAGMVDQLPFLQNEPELAEHLLIEYEAFMDLHRDRQSGFGLGLIPWSSVDRYAARHGICGADEFDRFKRLMMTMDAAFCAHHEEKNAKK